MAFFIDSQDTNGCNTMQVVFQSHAHTIIKVKLFQRNNVSYAKRYFILQTA